MVDKPVMKSYNAANMSKKSLVITTLGLLLLAITFGFTIFLSINANGGSGMDVVSPIVTEGSTKPLAEKSDLPMGTVYPRAVDLSTWNSFSSADGGVEFSYPDRMSAVENYVKKIGSDEDEPRLGYLENDYFVQFQGSYLPSDTLAEFQQAGFEYDDEMTGYIYVFSEGVGLESLLQSLGIYAPEDGQQTIIDGIQFTTHEDLYAGQARKKIFLGELSDGRVLYVQFNLSTQSLQDPYYQWQIADHIMKETIASISVSGTRTQQSSYEKLSNGRIKYTNYDLGLSFIYPSEYALEEQRSSKSDEPSVKGESLYISLNDNDLGKIFSLNATSSDYWEEKFQEGCCYVYTAEPTDLSLNTTALEQIIERELLKIFIPEKVTLNGASYLKSMFAGAYVQTWVEAMYLAPLGHPLYNNILFESDRLIYADGAPEDVQRDIFDNHANTHDWRVYSELDQEKISAFEDIMSTVELE